MCYEEENHDLATFDGVKVKVLGQLGDSISQIADVYVDDGAGIERLVNLIESEKGEWDGFTYEVTTVDSIDSVIYDELQDRRRNALVRVFLDEFEYKTLDEKERDAKLDGIAEVAGDSAHIHSHYARLLYQIDESLVSEETREFAECYPPIIDERWAAQLRKSIKSE